MGIQLVVTLGALLADVPTHSHPVAMSGVASDPALTARLGLRDSDYEGPTGIVGVLNSACTDAGLPAASLWATVPHYVAAAGQPEGRARARAQAGDAARRRLRGREQARDGRRRLRASGQPRRPERPRDPGLRRAPGAGAAASQEQRGRRRTTSPAATCSRASSSASCASCAPGDGGTPERRRVTRPAIRPAARRNGAGRQLSAAGQRMR